MVQTRWGMEYPSRTLLLQELQGLESTPPALEQVWERENKDSEDQARYNSCFASAIYSLCIQAGGYYFSFLTSKC